MEDKRATFFETTMLTALFKVALYENEESIQFDFQIGEKKSPANTAGSLYILFSG